MNLEKIRQVAFESEMKKLAGSMIPSLKAGLSPEMGLTKLLKGEPNTSRLKLRTASPSLLGGAYNSTVKLQKLSKL